MKITIRVSGLNDLDFLEKLERSCFPQFQQTSRRSIRYSLTSPFQKVVVVEIHSGKTKTIAGSATFYIYAKTLRIFSIAVLPDFQGKGIGKHIL